MSNLDLSAFNLFPFVTVPETAQNFDRLERDEPDPGNPGQLGSEGA